jgi:hypothetical protein
MRKTIRTVAMAAAMFVAVTTVAKAQGGGGGGGRGNRPNPALVVLKDSLKVSDAVFAKADSIAKVYGAKQAELRTSANGDMASVAPKMQELRTQQTADLKALLTDEQKAQFDKIMAAMPQGRRGGPPPTR